MDGVLARGRLAFEHNRWLEAYAALADADKVNGLDPGDLEALAVAAHLCGDYDVRTQAYGRAYEAWLERAEPTRAVRCAFWLSHLLVLSGQHSQGNAWLGHAEDLVEKNRIDAAELGLVRMWAAKLQMVSGDRVGGAALLASAEEVASTCDDPDLQAFTRLVAGQSLIDSGEVATGMRRLDEAMLVVTAGRTTPVATGIVYCATILYCRQALDLRRASEWTQALADWCDAQRGLVPFRTQCLVHVSELLQLHGRWREALEQATAACRHATGNGDPALGMALYQRGELHRLRGEFAAAEATYDQASAAGYDPQPGLALLRCAQKRDEAALAMGRRAAGEAHSNVSQLRTLAAMVDIALSCGDLSAARAAADGLAELRVVDSIVVDAAAAYAQGQVTLAEKDPTSALHHERIAMRLWSELDAPYEQARARELVAVCCAELGDAETARTEHERAVCVYKELGAEADLQRMHATTPGSLTAREVEVLRHVAQGASNREVAETLVISEKTVERHLGNIYNKIDVGNRVAATAFAHDTGLV